MTETLTGNTSRLPNLLRTKFLRSSLDVCRGMLLVLVVLFHAAAGAQEGGPVHPSKKRVYAPEIWKEETTNLPSATGDEHFSVVEVTGMGDSIFKVDLSSVRLGDDGVVRLTLAVLSSQGQANIFFEGFRCETSGYKSYAMRTGFNSPWVTFRSSKWRPVRLQRRNNYRADLVRYYICPALNNSGREDDIVSILRKGKIRKLDRRAIQQNLR